MISFVTFVQKIDEKIIVKLTNLKFVLNVNPN